MALIRVSDQPELVRTDSFPHGKYPFEYFNCVQSRVFELKDKNCNCVIAAPTSVGKTVCAEMFMADLPMNPTGGCCPGQVWPPPSMRISTTSAPSLPPL